MRYRQNHSPQLSTAKRQERMERWLSIQEIMIAPVDTKVSIGTFVQLIRRLTSGLLRGYCPASLDRAGERRVLSVERINAFCIKVAGANRY